MNAELDQIKQDIVVIQNIGSTTVTYEWKRVQRGDHVRAKQSDFAQRFFCHYPKSMLKPGESKSFTFSFKSAKVGMFTEEWELLTDPLLTQPLNVVTLTGIATQEDQLKGKRDEFWKNFSSDYPEEPEYTIDMLEGYVRNQPEQKPDLSDPYILCEVFEDRNRHLGLYYSRDVLETLFDIFDDLRHVLTEYQQEADLPEEWDTRVETLSDMIRLVKNSYTHQSIHERFIKTVAQAKKTPNDRAHSFKIVGNAVASFVEVAVDADIAARTALDLPQLESWQAIPEDWTPE
jgi:hypothetical protein